jgi:hypothetical protein
MNVYLYLGVFGAVVKTFAKTVKGMAAIMESMRSGCVTIAYPHV